MTWTILCISYTFQLSGYAWSAIVSGLGLVAAATAINAVFNIISLIIMVVTVLCGGGIVHLALIGLADQPGPTLGHVEPAQAARVRHVETTGTPFARRARGTDRSRVQVLAHRGRRGCPSPGRQLFHRQLPGTHREIPAYFAAYSLIYNMAVVSMNIGDASFVYVSKLWNPDRPQGVTSLVLRNVRLGLAMMLSGVAIMASIGDTVVTVWLGPGHFAGWPVMLTLCVMLVLFVQQQLLLGFSRSTGNEIYAPCYLLAGALNLAITWALAGPLGVVGVALGTLLAQLATTTWFVPATALARLQIKFKTYATEVLLPVGCLFGVTYTLVSVSILSVPVDVRSSGWRSVQRLGLPR